MSSRRTALVLFALAAGASCPTAHAQATVIVGPGDSIQQAVDAAPPGTTIQLQPGTYAQSVTVSKDGLTLQGMGAAGIVLDGRSLPADSGIHIVDARGVTIENLTVRGFRLYDVLIGDPGRAGSGGAGHRLREIVATGARLADKGQGIAIYAAADVTVEACSPSANPIGIAIGESPDCDCRIEANPVYGNTAVGIAITETSGVRLVSNQVGGARRGIDVRDSGAGVVLSGNRVENNSIGVAISNTDDVSVHMNAIQNNNLMPSGASPPGGIGLALWGASRSATWGNQIRGHVAAGIELSRGSVASSPASRGNRLCGNVLAGNRIDIMQDSGSGGNTFYCAALPQLDSPGR